MARITGKNGKITLGGVQIATIDEWAIDAKIPTADLTAMGDSFKSKGSLIREWSATFKAKWDSTLSSVTNLFDSAFAAATTSGGPTAGKVTLVFYPDAAASEAYTGDAFVDFSLKVPVGGAVQADCKAQGTGSLVRTP